MFVTFEGVEGSGKTTQIARLAARLEVGGKSVVRTREPGGTPLADEIRAIFLRPRKSSIPGEAELFLVLAARASHIREVIEPALAREEIVLCDRFSDATLAYQGYGRGLDCRLILEANRLATAGLGPRWTILLDLPAEEGLGRARARNRQTPGLSGEDRIDSETLEFHRRVRDGYLALAAGDPKRFTLFDARLDAGELERLIAAEAGRRGLCGEAP